MATEIITRHVWTDHGDALVAATAHDADLMAKLPRMRDLRADIVRPRDLTRHKNYWALCKLVHENQSRMATVQNVSDALKVLAGHCEILTTLDGEMVRVPKSIAFHRMDETEFAAFWRSVRDVVITRLLPGVTKAEIEHELAGMIGLERRAA